MRIDWLIKLGSPGIPKDAAYSFFVAFVFYLSLLLDYASLLLEKEFFNVAGRRLRVSWLQTTIGQLSSHPILATQREEQKELLSTSGPLCNSV